MNDLVFIEPKQLSKIYPFTTSEVIAEHALIEHRAIKQLIIGHKKDLEEFGVLTFEMSKPLKGSKGGRPEKNYKLNEQQATLVITYLQNTAPVRAFKKELVRQFFLMREELTKRQLNRSALTVNRRELTDSIKDNPDKGKWSYKLYTDLAYKTALGKTSGQIRKERGADRRAGAVELLTADELEGVTKVSYQIAVLHDMGMSYEEIKAMYQERLIPALQSTTKGGHTQ